MQYLVYGLTMAKQRNARYCQTDVRLLTCDRASIVLEDFSCLMAWNVIPLTKGCRIHFRGDGLAPAHFRVWAWELLAWRMNVPYTTG